MLYQYSLIKKHLLIAVVVSISAKRSLFEIIHIKKPRQTLFLDVSELSSHFKSMDERGEVVFEKKKMKQMFLLLMLLKVKIMLQQ